MKWIFCLLTFSVLVADAQRKAVSFNELMTYTYITNERMSSVVSKKGFRRNQDEAEMMDQGAFFNKVTTSKLTKQRISQQISRFESNENSSVLFQTTYLSEYKELKDELVKNGFIPMRKRIPVPDVTEYQRGSMMAKAYVDKEEEITVYNIALERKQLPTIQDLKFAEDLVDLDAHEYLLAVYGPQNVKKDLFYFSETETNTCSVLFPNTHSQVIFVWEDQMNARKLSFLIIGGTLREEGSVSFKQVEHNKWYSKQGLHLGMSLSDMVRVNGEHIRMYGFETEQPGYATFDNKGKINFSRLGLQLNCIDCKEDSFYTNTDIISSDQLLRNSSRVFLNKIVVLPHASASGE